MVPGRLCESNYRRTNSSELDPPLATWRLLRIEWTAAHGRELSVWRACYLGKESGLQWLVDAEMVQEVGLVRAMKTKLTRRLRKGALLA